MRRVLPVGSLAPSAALLDSEGRTTVLRELFASGRILLYFYPRAHTPYCTRQACNLRDLGDDLARWGVRVVGVSGDSPRRLASFRRRHDLPFLLLSDRSGAAFRAFGLPAFLGFVKRSSFLIEEGVVVWRDLHPRVGTHAEDLLRMLQARPGTPLPEAEEVQDPDRPPGSWSSAG